MDNEYTSILIKMVSKKHRWVKVTDDDEFYEFMKNKPDNESEYYMDIKTLWEYRKIDGKYIKEMYYIMTQNLLKQPMFHGFLHLERKESTQKTRKEEENGLYLLNAKK